MKTLLLLLEFVGTLPFASIMQAQGAWTYGSSKDEMTDAPRFHISADSRPTYGGRGDLIKGTIVWRCSAADGREVFILFDKYFGGNRDDQVLVETRFDSAPSSEAVLWNLSTSKHGVFMPSEEIPRFTDRIRRSKRLLVRVTDPLDAEAITYSFNVLGFTSAYRRLEANCPRDDAPAVGVDSLKHVEGDIEKVIAPVSDQVFMESVVEERPEVLSGPSLVYPDLLRQAGVQGRVIVQAIIDTSGRAEPQSVKVIQSPNPGFDQPAKTYVLGALWRPARIHGRAVRVLLNLPIDFNIKR